MLIRRNWGFFILSAFSLLAGVQLLAQEVPGHYRVFTRAAQALWAGVTPYGTDFGTRVGYWFYSPSCGMVFFAPFSLLPEKIGLAAYMALSWVVFILGARRFVAVSLYKTLSDPSCQRFMNLFWIAVIPQLFSGILASKIEIMMVGILFLASSWLVLQRNVGAASFLLAMVLNWKFQPLPSIGLILIVWILLKRGWRLPLMLALFSIFWSALPFLFKPARFLVSIYYQWNETLSSFVREAWSNFDNIFSFLIHCLDLHFSFEGAQLISVSFGAFFAGAVFVWTLYRRKNAEIQQTLREGIGLAFALGSAYTVVFSPLSQNNSYILAAPLVLASLLMVREASGLWKKLLAALVFGAWFVIALGYSDIVPPGIREQMRHLGIKPAVSLGLALAILGLTFARRRIPG